MPSPILARSSWIGIGKETTQGTAVAPTLYVPVMNPKPEDVITYIDDDSLFPSPTKVRAVYQGVRDTKYDYEFYALPEYIGLHMVAAGLADTVLAARTVTDGVTTNNSNSVTSATAAFTVADVGASVSGAGIPTGTVIAQVGSTTQVYLTQTATATATGLTFNIGGTGGQYRHRFALPATATQPPSFTITDYNGNNTRQYPGCILDAWDLTIDSKGIAKFAVKWMGWPSLVSGSGTPAFATSVPYLGWQAAASMNGALASRYLSASISYKRSAEAIHTLQNQQAPSVVFAAEAECQAKVKAYMLDDTDLSLFINNTQAPLDIVLQATGGTTLAVTMSKAAVKKAPIDRSTKYLSLDMDVEGVYNANDLGPVGVTLQNTSSAAY